MFGLPQLALAIALAAGLVISGFGYGTHRANAKHELQRLQAVEAAREKEAQWQSDVEVLNDVRDEELARVAAARDAAVRELRNRPDRMPAAAAAACNGTTGAQLSRPDAEAFAGLAADADRVRADLQACLGWAETVMKR